MHTAAGGALPAGGGVADQLHRFDVLDRRQRLRDPIAWKLGRALRAQAADRHGQRIARREAQESAPGKVHLPLHLHSMAKATVEISAFAACRESSLVCWTTMGTSETITEA